MKKMRASTVAAGRDLNPADFEFISLLSPSDLTFSSCRVTIIFPNDHKP
jgi:hypothetical protein